MKLEPETRTKPFLFLMSVILVTLFSPVSSLGTDPVLYNGIVLPDDWPPSEKSDPRAPAPYLSSPPQVIPIDAGRQLFVDDFLIESTSCRRTFHRAENYAGNPVLRPDKPWENPKPSPQQRGDIGGLVARTAPFSDGVWYDPEDGLFKMWYMAGSYPRETCYAASRDGLHWHKPVLDVVNGTNIVLPTDGDRRDANTVWLDLNEKDPRRRYKMWQVMHYGKGMSDSRLNYYISADGIHWSREAVSDKHLRGERTTVFYNPFRKVWVYSIRNNSGGRHRDYQEDADPRRGTREVEKHATPWVCADSLDLRLQGVACQLYNLDGFAYESLILGLFSIWRGDPRIDPEGMPKYYTDVCIGYSRDGFHWTRPDRQPFCATSNDEKEWNWNDVQSAGGGCLVVGDRLYFYLSGAAARTSASSLVGPGYAGLMFLRRDGFASLDAGEEGGWLTTRPVVFTGKYMFVNVDCEEGELQVEILDGRNEVIAPYTRNNCIPIKTDKTLQAVEWKGANDLSRLSGKAVKFRFHLTHGNLYAFWVTQEANGASFGYVAAGGPGLQGHVDTLGADGYPE